MADYRVTSLVVTPTQDQFASDEDVKLRVQCTVERRSSLMDATVLWASDYYLNSIAAQNLKDSVEHVHAPWHEIDTEEPDFELNLGPYSPGTLEGNIIVAAHTIG